MPDDLLNYLGFCIVGSLDGTVQDIDMDSFRTLRGDQNQDNYLGFCVVGSFDCGSLCLQDQV